MKTTSIFKTVTVIAIVIASTLGFTAKAQDQFITNQVMNGELVASKTIFKKNGSYLQRHIQYVFTYDSENRLTGKEALKWNTSKDEWMPYFKMTFQYSENEITMDYAQWNESNKAYNKNMQKSVYELNDENMPTAYRIFKEKDMNKSDWSLVNHERINNVTKLLAIAR